ncbi:hypothetical protein CMI37_36870 [Candidatus Pacearchaeota archaeon]|nr:hypothetical protein [Candidatus Pacearchaeota archaeon]
MAYQNIGTPRFFVDHLLWLKTLGLEYYTGGGGGIISSESALIGLNPSQSNIVDYAGGGIPYAFVDYVAAPPIMTSDNKWKSYIAILGHSSASAQAKITFALDSAPNQYPDYRINFSPDTFSPYNGFTLGYNFDNTGSTIGFGFDPSNETDGYLTDFNIGCISHGNYYDMTNAPNLSLTMSREYGGIKEFTTHNGSSMSNLMQDKPPKWGNLGAWELLKIDIEEPEPDILLGDINADGGINVLDVVALVNIILSEGSAEDFPAGDLTGDELINILDIIALINIILSGGREDHLEVAPQSLSRSSRRSWDLKFSYIDDSDLFGSNQMLSQHFDISSSAGYGLDDSYLEESQIPVETLTNGDFEGDFIEVQSGDFVAEDWWYEGFYTRQVFTEETSNVYSGSKAQKIVQTYGYSGSGSWGLERHSDHYLALDAGVIYNISFKVYRNITKEMRVRIRGIDGVPHPEFWEDGEWGDSECRFTPTQDEWYSFEIPFRVMEDTPINSEFSLTIHQYNSITDVGDSMILDKFELTTTNMTTLFKENLLTNDNFFSQVWHKTLGGTLPFIFQPDNSNNNPDQFAIAKFDPNSLKATQSAHNVYDISLKIEEVW